MVTTPREQGHHRLWSDKIAHPPIIDREIFDQVQALVHGRAANMLSASRTAGSVLTRCAALAASKP